MASQTQPLNSRFRTPGPVEGMRNSIVDLISDFLHLIELQARMLGFDATTAWNESKPAILLAILSIGGLLAALPVFCIGIATGVSIAGNAPLWLCQIGTGGAITLISIAMAYLSIRRIRSALATFSRSQRELESNVAWLRTSIETSQGRESW